MCGETDFQEISKEALREVKYYDLVGLKEQLLKLKCECSNINNDEDARELYRKFIDEIRYRQYADFRDGVTSVSNIENLYRVIMKPTLCIHAMVLPHHKDSLLSFMCSSIDKIIEQLNKEVLTT